NAPNAPNDPFGVGGSMFDASFGGAGGVWVIRCKALDGFSSGANSGGSNSQGEEIARFRQYEAVGNGRFAGNQNIPRYGIESSGNSMGLPEQSMWVMYSTLYGNYGQGAQMPHGPGASYWWNNTAFRSGQHDGNLGYNACVDFGEAYNNLVKSPSMAWGTGT